MKLLPAISTAFLATGLLFSLNAQSVTTDPVGYVTLEIPANSDTFLSFPLHQSSVYQGQFSFVSNNADEFTFQASGAEWTEGEFSNAFYIRLISGEFAGFDFDILSNTSSSVSLDSRGIDLSSVNNESFLVIPHWTLDRLFPPASQTAIVPSLGNFGFQRRTTVFIPNYDGLGINRSASESHFISVDSWVRSDATNTPSGNTVIYPGMPIIIRHPLSVTESTYINNIGAVLMSDISIPVFKSSVSSQDNFISNPFPVAVSLRELALVESGAFAPSAGNFGFQRTDTLFSYRFSDIGINRGASASYFFADGEWRESTAGNPIVSDLQIIEPGQVLIIRKSQGIDDTDIVWRSSLSNVISSRN